MSTPKVKDLFGGTPGLSARDMSERYDQFTDAMINVAEKSITRVEIGKMFGEGVGLNFAAKAGPATPLAALQAALTGDIQKGLSADSLAQITAALQAQAQTIPDLTKDITTSSPISTGL